ncbi:MAG: Ig-like domain repeat protein, partial [Terracidiphilus sp.]
GNLYTGSNGGVLKLIRTQGYVLYAGTSSAPQTVSLLESGNQAMTLSSVSQSDSTDYSLVATASTDCTLNGSLPSSLAVGGVCALTAGYTPITYLITTDTVAFTGNYANAALSTPSSLQLVLTGPATAPASAITLGSFSPASPIYGQSVSVSATVTGSSLTPAGTVVFTVDDTTTYSGTVNSSGIASASLPGLSAGNHQVSAAYTSSNGYASSSTQTVQLTVNQASQTINFTQPSSPLVYPVAAPITLVATGGASGNPVTFSVTGPATLSGNTLTITAVGSVVVTANQAGNSNYSAATPVSYTIVVSQVAGVTDKPTIVPGGGSLQYSSTTSVTVTMADTTTGASIYYTTDGSTPSATHGTRYNGSFVIPQTAVAQVVKVQAMATAPGYTASAVVAANYHISAN